MSRPKSKSASEPIGTSESKPAKRRYDWPPPAEPYTPVRKNPIESIITALPVIMLIVGLYLFYRHEGAETGGKPLFAQTEEVQGEFEGLSSVASGGEGRHYLWVLTDERRRGPRLTAEEAKSLSILEKGDRVTVFMAPHVEGSRTLWVWKVVRGNELLFDSASGRGR